MIENLFLINDYFLGYGPKLLYNLLVQKESVVKEALERYLYLK
jgi:hypothetical protein